VPQCFLSSSISYVGLEGQDSRWSRCDRRKRCLGHSGETMDRPDRSVRLYRATIWTSDPNRPGQRVSALAEGLDEAMEKLEAEYGKGNVFNLHNEEDAARPR
jgi:hypothetical protein